MAAQALVAIAISFVLADFFLFPVRYVPFTHLHKGVITDLPLAVVRYFVIFPSVRCDSRSPGSLDRGNAFTSF